MIDETQMRYHRSRSAAWACLFLVASSWCGAQQTRSDLAERAKREFLDQQYAAAERDFRELLKSDPSNPELHLYLGHALFKQEKYAEAVGPYEKVRTLGAGAKTIPEDQRRVLTDQLVMAYGISGQMKKAHDLLDEAISKDPDYPLNYYNRACAYAEDGDKARVLANLQLAFERKANVLKGEQMPDPRGDSSFQKYVRDPEFVSLMKRLGYK